MTEKTALVTGCSQGGLGEALAKAFRARGFRVFAALRNPAKAGPLANQEGIEIVELDVASQESIDKCVKSIEKLTGGTLDVLVNNAASTAADASVKPLLDVSIAEAKKAYEVNVWAILAMAQAFAPLLIKARGVICNINSVFCEITHAWTGIYNSSKAANRMMSEIMRLEMAPLGVRVVSVILGGVATSQNDPNNREDLKLPENSRYQKIAPAINRHKKGLVFQDKQDADEAAKKIVNDVLSGRHYFIRHGSGSTMSWFGNTFMPYDRFTSMVNGQSGLDGLGK